MKHILIDCFKLIKGEGKSVGIYNVAVDLVKLLAQLCSDGRARVSVIANEHNVHEFEPIKDKVGIIIEKALDPKSKKDCVIWELFTVTARASMLNADIVVYPRGYAPLFKSAKRRDVVLIHDLIPFFYDEVFPGYMKRVENLYIKLRLFMSAKQSDGVITISEASRNDMIRRFKISGDKVAIVPNGVPDYMSAMAANNDRENAAEAYIVAVTSNLPHKNTVGIVKGYESYVKAVRGSADKNKPVSLVIVGIDNIDGCAIDESVAPYITCRGFIKSGQEYQRIMSGALFFVFLSYVEGFGLPVIESMSRGVPVLCSDIESLREVAGEAAVLVNHTDYESIGRGIERLAKDEMLRKSLSEKGYENLKRFDNSKRAQGYYDAIVGE